MMSITLTVRHSRSGPYTRPVPKLWSETIQSHRQEVQEAILHTTARLVAEHGPLSVTMSRIAEETGIGRATLYKYFADVEAILNVWHERQIAHHLQRLTAARDEKHSPWQRLEAVLVAYALTQHETRDYRDTDLAALLHRGGHVSRARQRVRDLIRELLSEAAASGDVRDDVAPEELAVYCLNALSGAGGLPSNAAVGRLVAVTMAGLRARP